MGFWDSVGASFGSAVGNWAIGAVQKYTGLAPDVDVASLPHRIEHDGHVIGYDDIKDGKRAVALDGIGFRFPETGRYEVDVNGTQFVVHDGAVLLDSQNFDLRSPAELADYDAKHAREKAALDLIIAKNPRVNFVGTDHYRGSVIDPSVSLAPGAMVNVAAGVSIRNGAVIGASARISGGKIDGGKIDGVVSGGALDHAVVEHDAVVSGGILDHAIIEHDAVVSGGILDGTHLKPQTVISDGIFDDDLLGPGDVSAYNRER